MTVFRKLKEIGYLSGYSHRGRYYTLAQTAHFDELGVWSFGGRSLFPLRHLALDLPGSGGGLPGGILCPPPGEPAAGGGQGGLARLGATRSAVPPPPPGPLSLLLRSRGRPPQAVPAAPTAGSPATSGRQSVGCRGGSGTTGNGPGSVFQFAGRKTAPLVRWTGEPENRPWRRPAGGPDPGPGCGHRGPGTPATPERGLLPGSNPPPGRGTKGGGKKTPPSPPPNRRADGI